MPMKVSQTPKSAEEDQLEATANRVRVGTHKWCFGPDGPSETEVTEIKQRVPPWLAALIQCEHLNLLVGNGLTTAVASLVDIDGVSMSIPAILHIDPTHIKSIRPAAESRAKRSSRGEANIEDLMRAISELVDGLGVLAKLRASTKEDRRQARTMQREWRKVRLTILDHLLKEIFRVENGIFSKLVEDSDAAHWARQLLGSFLLTFAGRTPTRDRLHILTTNYDRVIELGADMIGLRILDRFVGEVYPVFRSSRLGIDMHYSPPGIRGEPRYLEGVIQLSKLHGSVDWTQGRALDGGALVVRQALPLGGRKRQWRGSSVPKDLKEHLLIYPNSAKDTETLEYPYAELFRDFATATCRPNAVLFTYGYGFGDDHINRVIRDMLTIPSTHLAVMSYDDPGGRISNFLTNLGRDEQVTYLIGPHFGELETLVTQYLPKPALDRITRKVQEPEGSIESLTSSSEATASSLGKEDSLT